MTDIHSHIIPNIDDGASAYSEAAVMLRLAAENGTSAIVATPHYYNRFQCIRRSSKAMLIEAYEKLHRYIKQNEIPIRVYLGAETFGVNNISELIRQNEIVSVNGSRYVLTEFDFEDDFQRVRYCIMQLKAGGFVPVIAHPERYVFLHAEPANVYWFLEQSCILQINKGSPLGRYGEDAMSFSRWMLENRFAHVVASDAHSPFRRTTDMSGAYDWIVSRYGREYAEELFTVNPEKIVKDLSF